MPSHEIYLDMLIWRETEVHEFSMLVLLGRRVLAIPRSQVQSERLFSSAGIITTKNKNSPSVDNVELFVTPKNS